VATIPHVAKADRYTDWHANQDTSCNAGWDWHTTTAARFTVRPKTELPGPITLTQSPVKVAITTVYVTQPRNVFLIVVSVQHEERLAEYQTDLISSTGIVVLQVRSPAPRHEPIRMPFGMLNEGDFIVRVSAIAKNGQIVAFSEVPIRYLLPSTPTPTLSDQDLPEPLNRSNASGNSFGDRPIVPDDR
jgi:hypothetical protein